MSVLQDLASQLIQGGPVDDLTLVVLVVGPLHSAWVALSTGECAAEHWLTSLVIAMVFIIIIIIIIITLQFRWGRGMDYN